MHSRNLEVFNLNNMTPVAFYWLGFLLADGHFRIKPKSVELSIEISKRDLIHLQKFLIFLGRKETSFTSRTRQTALSDHLQTHVSFRLSSQRELVDLVTWFKINSNKTEFPPDVSAINQLTTIQKLCLLIGYIDGDGHIRGRKGTLEGKIEGHPSWYSIYQCFASVLPACRVYKYTRKEKNNSEFGVLYMYSDSIKLLLSVISSENLPILQRKWESATAALSYIPQYTQKETTRLKAEVSKLRQTHTQNEVANKLNITLTKVKYLDKLLRKDDMGE